VGQKLGAALTVYTYFAASIFDLTQGGDPAQLRNGIFAFVAVMSVSLTPTVIQQVRRWRRYRRLLVERHARRLRLPRRDGAAPDRSSD